MTTSTEDFSVLTWPEKSWRLTEMAAQVAPRFGLPEAEFCLVGDIEGYGEPGGILACAKFKTTVPDSQYLLTIYYAFSGAPEPSGFDRRLAFMHWADYLTDHGIQAPVKVPDLNGDLIYKAAINLPNGTSVQSASVLDAWIQGDVLEAREEDLTEIAELMATMHAVSTGWSFPPGLGDRVDHATLQSRQSMIRKPFEDGRVGVEYQDLVEQTFDKVVEDVRVLPQKDELWGACHLDLDVQNCLRTPAGMRAIDFDGAGLAYYAFDIALTIKEHPPKLREAFLSSYQKRRSLSGDTQKLLETFIVMDRLRDWVTRADLSHDKVRKPDDFEWAPGFMGEFDLYVTGRPFLFSQAPASLPQR